MLLADRLSSTSAPAAAPAVLGGAGTHRSSQISTWHEKPVGRRPQTPDRRPKGAHARPTAIVPPHKNFPEVKWRRRRIRGSSAETPSAPPPTDARGGCQAAIIKPPLAPQRRADDNNRSELLAGRDQPD